MAHTTMRFHGPELELVLAIVRNQLELVDTRHELARGLRSLECRFRVAYEGLREREARDEMRARQYAKAEAVRREILAKA